MNQKRLYVLKARKLNCARRAAILLFTMMLTMTVQTAWAQDSGETNLVFPFTPTLVSAQPTNWDDSHYNAAKLFDGSYTGGGYGLSEGDVWVEFQFTDGIYPKGYALWTADNCLGSYNPKSWTLKAKKASGDAWTTLSTVDNTAGDKLPLANSTRAVFAIDNSEAYKYFRFEATKSDAGGFELSELKITSDQPNPYMQYASVTGLQDFYLYNDGSPIAINYAVTDALGHLLTKGTHYKETIRNSANQVVTELKEVGVYTLTIEGQNDLENQNSYFAYKGTKTLKFEIVNHKLPIKEVEYYGVPNIIVKREVVMSKTGRDVLELDGTIENIILFDEGYVNSYSNNCDGTLTIKAPRGYFLEVSGDISIEINDNLSIYDSDGINSSKLLGSYGPYFSRGMKCSSTGEYITFHFQSDGSGTSEGLYLNVNLVKIVPRSVEINIMGDGDKAPAEYGTFVSDKLMAVKGEPVTLTYTPNGDYELADMSVRGRVQGQLHEINYRVEEDDDMRWYTGKYTASFKMPENDVIVTTYFRIPNRFGYPIWAKVPKSGTKSITIPADVKEFDIYSYCCPIKIGID